MPITELLSMVPIAEILKQVISLAKKVKNFEPLFKELASTMERLVPIIQEMAMLQERLDPGNKELYFLTKTMRRAKRMVVECSRVQDYNALKKISYTEKIKGINEDFVKFCQVDVQLIHLRNEFRSRLLKREEAPPRREENSNISTRDEDEERAILESFKGKQHRVRRAGFDEDEKFAAALQESLNMQESPPGLEDVQRVNLESFKDKGKGKQLQDQENEQVAAALRESLNMEELSLRQAIQESNYLRQREEQVAKRRARELEEDEQIAKALLHGESEKITNGSSSSTRDPWEAQRMSRRVSKNKGKGKKYE